MTVYFHFLNLSVEHAFFRDGRCRNLNFVPSHGTRRLFENSDLLIRQTGNGVSLFASTAGLEALRLYASDTTEPLRLAFAAFSCDPYFGNYTQSADDGVFHFETTALAHGDEAVRLHQADYASEADCISAEAAAERLETSERLVKPVFVAVFELSATHLPNADAQGFRPHRYVIRFKAREIIWKYYLFGDLCHDGLSMRGQNGQLDFIFMGQERLSNEKSACTFRSATAIPLRERSDIRVQLLGGHERGGNNKVLVKRLPVASCTQLGRLRIDETDVLVSEIYVNC